MGALVVHFTQDIANVHPVVASVLHSGDVARCANDEKNPCTRQEQPSQDAITHVTGESQRTHSSEVHRCARRRSTHAQDQTMAIALDSFTALSAPQAWKLWEGLAKNKKRTKPFFVEKTNMTTPELIRAHTLQPWHPNTLMLRQTLLMRQWRIPPNPRICLCRACLHA